MIAWIQKQVSLGWVDHFRQLVWVARLGWLVCLFELLELVVFRWMTLPYTWWCPDAPKEIRQQMNMLTSWIDASQVYGSTMKKADKLRLYRKGDCCFCFMLVAL